MLHAALYLEYFLSDEDNIFGAKYIELVYNTTFYLFDMKFHIITLKSVEARYLCLLS